MFGLVDLIYAHQRHVSEQQYQEKLSTEELKQHLKEQTEERRHQELCQAIRDSKSTWF